MSIAKQKKAIVIGSGVAGLACAIRLQNKGYQVSVFESNNYVGGKLTSFVKDGYRFDAGPSLFTMPQYLEELFESCGKSLKDYLTYSKKEVACCYFFENGRRFTAYANPERFIKEAIKVFDVKESRLRKYFRNSARQFNATSSVFLRKSLHRLRTYCSMATLKAASKVHQLSIHTNLHQHNKSYFSDPDLVQLFDRFATYNGSSPYQTPGIMAMIPHLEHHYGTYFPDKGMQSITNALYQLALDLGVVFHLNHKVDQILLSDNHKEAIGIQVNHQNILADIVVSNMDIVPTYKNLLAQVKAPSKILNQERSSSALIFYWGISKQFNNLDLHNIFFSKDYRKEFDTIFKDKTIYLDPTVYINITSKQSSCDAPHGHENWFVMINVPSANGQDWSKLIHNSRKAIIKKLNRLLCVDLEQLITTEEVLDPTQIQARTQSYKGALYGSSSNSPFAAFLRHPNFSKKIKNLYFCGGSVHPGGGIPLCLLSASIVEDSLEAVH